jgi:hypothetical protein
MEAGVKGAADTDTVGDTTMEFTAKAMAAGRVPAVKITGTAARVSVEAMARAIKAAAITAVAPPAKVTVAAEEPAATPVETAGNMAAATITDVPRTNADSRLLGTCAVGTPVRIQGTLARGPRKDGSGARYCSSRDWKSAEADVT